MDTGSEKSRYLLEAAQQTGTPGLKLLLGSPVNGLGPLTHSSSLELCQALLLYLACQASWVVQECTFLERKRNRYFSHTQYTVLARHLIGTLNKY